MSWSKLLKNNLRWFELWDHEHILYRLCQQDRKLYAEKMRSCVYCTRSLVFKNCFSFCDHQMTIPDHLGTVVSYFRYGINLTRFKTNSVIDVAGLGKQEAADKLLGWTATPPAQICEQSGFWHVLCYCGGDQFYIHWRRSGNLEFQMTYVREWIVKLDLSTRNFQMFNMTALDLSGLLLLYTSLEFSRNRPT